MADKAISELVAAPSVTPDSLFVLQQDNTAKKLTAQVLENWLLSFAGGHGGIQSYELLNTVGLVKTYRFTLADQTHIDIDVVDGRGIESVKPTSTNGLVVTYTVTYNDNTTSTFTVTNGEKGDKGDRADIWVKYASQKPTASSHSFGDIPDSWIGIATGHNMDAAPTDWQEYTWYQWKGEKGDPGDPATLVRSEVRYQVGDSGTIIPSGSWSESVPPVTPGKYLWTRQVIQFNSGEPITSYNVSRFGIDGTGAVSTVAGVSPDENGNVPLDAASVKALPVAGGPMEGGIDMNGQPLSGLNAPTKDDEAANKGYVNQQMKKAAPRNLLDNSDFRNPVNQRGQKSYKELGYTIDRWTSVSYGNTVTVADGYIHLKTEEKEGSWRQYIEKYDRYIGKKMTIAAKLLDGSIVCASGTVPNTSDNAKIASYEDSQYHVSLHKLSDNILMQFSVFAAEISIEWAALYEGEYTAETLPDYQPKGYGAELVECYRYFVNLGRCNMAAKDEWGFYYGDIRFPVEMRIAPTVTFRNPLTGTVNAIGKWNGSSFVDFTDVVVGTLYENMCGFASSGGTLTAGTSYTADVTVSADL